MLETHLRQAATVLLESAIRIAPPDAGDWGRAMRSELNYVEGHWAAVMWALGGASVLVRRALASLLMPGRSRPAPGFSRKMFPYARRCWQPARDAFCCRCYFSLPRRFGRRCAFR